IGGSLSLDSTRTLSVTNTLHIGPGGSLALSGGTLAAGVLDADGNATRLNLTGGTFQVGSLVLQPCQQVCGELKVYGDMLMTVYLIHPQRRNDLCIQQNRQ